ncbi:MAG: chromosome segregation protein SMC, partial [Hyphomicrobiaceae bacterium]
RSSNVKRLDGHLSDTKRQIAHLKGTLPDPGERDMLSDRVETLRAAIENKEQEFSETERSIAELRQQTDAAQRRRERDALAMNQADSERRTLLKLLVHNLDAPAVVDQIIVDKGYETALGAALGDDLDAPVGNEKVVHWRDWNDVFAAEPHLPEGVKLLADVVKAPPALMKRLTMIGLVDSCRGASLQVSLKPGQRLVSKRGDMWRWDGFVVPAGAPSAAAQRLSARNRLRELDVELPDLVRAHAGAEAAVEELHRSSTAATSRQQDLRHQLRELRNEREAAQGQLATIESLLREAQTRLDVLQDRQISAEKELEAAKLSLVAAQAGLTEIEQRSTCEAEVLSEQAIVVAARDSAIDARSRSDALNRDCQRLAERSEQITAGVAQWQVRADLAAKQVGVLEDRLSVARVNHARTIAVPKKIGNQREELQNALDVAQARHRDAADKVVEAETAHKEAAQSLRTAQVQVGEEREIRARADVRLEAARSRRADIVRKIQEAFSTAPEGCLVQAGYAAEDDLPELDEAEGRLQRLKVDRERLGGVNLNAGEELERLNSQYDALETDRADIEAAIAKLRGGIASLNRDGRKRLKNAFETVNAHFQDLFTTLFGGGEARLEMIEDSADPLAGGLEILAKPPGKKPTTLSLLSGGEQSLTALALIFAVFLTNPSPICVLDEVDAPLDDANVDRFCTLMEKMARNTATRFLVITHHPMTMARVDRLFGVTMAERGVSQLVSVDLSIAEELLETA